jgi:hypothetical protein
LQIESVIVRHLEQRAGAAKARKHLVEDEQHAVLVA